MIVFQIVSRSLYIVFLTILVVLDIKFISDTVNDSDIIILDLSEPGHVNLAWNKRYDAKYSEDTDYVVHIICQVVKTGLNESKTSRDFSKSGRIS
jgi:hypothetical protein